MLDTSADIIALATAQLDAVAAAYARATNIVRPLMRDIPDGHIAVGAMDGWTAVVPKPDFRGADGLSGSRWAVATDPTRRMGERRARIVGRLGTLRGAGGRGRASSRTSGPAEKFSRVRQRQRPSP